jgi:hypothetical protein
MTARDCPVPEIDCLGRTLHTWRAELLAHFAHRRLQRADRIQNNYQTSRIRTRCPSLVA